MLFETSKERLKRKKKDKSMLRFIFRPVIFNIVYQQQKSHGLEFGLQ